MHLIYRVFLFITYFGIIIHCKGVRVNLRGFGFCTASECKYEVKVILGLIFGVIYATMALSCFIKCYSAYRAGRPCKNNQTFIKSSNSNQRSRQLHEVNAFQSGTWSARYHQDNIWHISDQLSLSFDPQSTKVTGSGLDSVGAFTIDGIYSITTHRMGLTKTYQKGTAKPAKNSGHEMIIQLTWNEKNHQFEGKWYVRTSRYKNSDEFVLKFNAQPRPFGFENGSNEQILLHYYV